MTIHRQNDNRRWRKPGPIEIIGSLFTAALLLGGCYDTVPWTDIEPVTVEHALQSHGGCGSFEEYAKSAASQLMRAQVEAARDQEAEWAGRGGGDVAVGAPEAGSADMDDNGGQEEGGDHSETNNQEEGVDEADLVKTDGTYIYTLHLGELVIVEASEDGQLAEMGRAEVGGYADELFILGDQAVVFSTLYDQEVPEELRHDRPQNAQEPGFDCWDEWCWQDNRYSQIALVDLSDRAQPTVVRTVIYAGEYQTSRRVGSAVRAVIFSPLPELEMSWGTGDDRYAEWSSVSGVNSYYKDLIEENDERFAALTLDDILPRKVDSVNGEIVPIAACENILGSKTPAGIGLTTVVSLDLDEPTGTESAVAVFGAKGIVYATEESLYLTTSRRYVMEAFQSGLWDEESSGLHKFDIGRSDAAAFYLASGAVPGRLLDQFCLGEHDGFLRVATTTGNEWAGDELENHVRVLEEKGEALKVVGELDGLGLGQEIYAARFMGDRGFMVTFRQVDPLYTMDMSDPRNPRTVGEWHGPGYSTYLHPVGDNHLVSVGLDQWQVAISLYDLTDFADPTLVTRLKFSNDAYSSAATEEHKAFTFNPETGFLALPFYRHTDNATGLYTYEVSEAGIAERSTLYLNGDDDEWEGEARRSVYIGDHLYGLSRCRITSGLIDDPTQITATLPLFTIGSCDDYGNQWYGEDW